MKSKRYGVLLMALAMLGATVLSSFQLPGDGGEWVTFKDKKRGKFEVLLPEKPQAYKDNKNALIYRAALDEPLTNFYVAVTFLQDKFTDSTFVKKTKEYMTGLAGMYNDKFDEPAVIQFNGGICLEYRYTMLGMKSLRRIFYKDNIMYELTVNPVTGDIPKESTEKFFNSFKFLP